LVTLLDDSTQYFKVKQNIEGSSTSKEEAFCRYTIEQSTVLVIEDAMEDQRFSNNPSVLGAPHIRFYAGAPLTTREGFKVGSLCVIDDKPKQLDAVQISCLQTLARLVMERMELSQGMRAMPGGPGEVNEAFPNQPSYNNGGRSELHSDPNLQYSVVGF
jgi:GAF domain-containing protein